MKPFVHFILTRFNAPLKNDAPPEQASTLQELDPDWLTRRFELFERVGLPSVNRQTEGALQWLVFMDWATPVEFKERMAALTVRHDFLRPVYCSGFDEATILAEIRRREGPEKVRITTSLDSDQALHPRLIEQVQELARNRIQKLDLQRGFYIGFPLGCCEAGGNFYLQRRRTNPFLSFISSPDCDRTVLSRAPGESAVAAPVFLRCARPMWCVVRHADTRTAPLRGIYWPWGDQSEFAFCVADEAPRSVVWKCAEVLRSLIRGLPKRDG